MTAYFRGALFIKVPGVVPCNTRRILVKKGERWHSERDALGVRFYSTVFLLKHDPNTVGVTPTLHQVGGA